jgi:FkbM family methyltransferase
MTIYTFLTPGWNSIEMECRDDTIDFDTCQAILVHDEYQLAGLSLDEKTVFDIGSHVGAFAIAVLRDHLSAQVVAVEPLVENVEAIQANAVRNGVQDRLTVVCAAAGAPGDRPAHIGKSISHTARHRFIGQMGSDVDGVVVPTVSFGELVQHAWYPVALVKVDCEGCEWRFLAGDGVLVVPRIVGEIHSSVGDHGMPRTDVAAILGATHDLEFSGPETGTCEFVATRR